MQHRPVHLQRLLIIAFLALVQLFAPLVHAHTGDSWQDGVHVHIPGADPVDSGPVLSADPGMEIGIETMRRESSGLLSEIEPPALIDVTDTARDMPDRARPSPSFTLAAPATRMPDAHPSRGPPAAPSC